MSTKIRYPKGFDPADPQNADIVQRTQEFFDTIKTATEEELCALVREGICLEARDGGIGFIPLIWAAEYGKENTTRLLMDLGVNMGARSSYGSTALRLAAQHGRENTVRLLIDLGVNIEAVDDDDDSVLWLAAINGKENITRLLIGYGGDIETRDILDRTALMAAAANDKENTTRCLLERGANVYARDFAKGRPIYEIIKRGWDIDIRAGEEAYADFAANHTAPKDKAGMYQLLAFTPLVDEYEKVDYLGNLGRIVSHAKWENKEQAEEILREMQADGVITPADVTTLLHQSFPAPNTHRLLTSRSDGRGR